MLPITRARFFLAVIWILVCAPVAQAAWVRGASSIDLTADGRYAVIAFRRDKSVGIVDLTMEPFSLRNVTGEDGIPLCPLTVRCMGSRAVVVSDLTRQLTIIDVPSGRVVSTVEVPLYCQEVLRDEKRNLYYVSNRSRDSVLVFDSAWAELQPIAVGRMPGPMTLGARGRLWVGNRGSHDVSIVDLDARVEVARVPLGSRPEGLASTGSAVLVTNHGGAELRRLHSVPVIEDDQRDIRNIVTSFDAETLERTELFCDRGADYAGIDVRAGLVAFSGAGSGTVHLASCQAGSELTTVDLLVDGGLPGATAPDGRRVYAHVRDVVARTERQVLAITFLRDTLVELRRDDDGDWHVHSETALNPAGRPVLAFDKEGEPSLTPRQAAQLDILTLSGWQGGQKDFTCFTCHVDWHTDFRLLVDRKDDPFHSGGQAQGPERIQSLRYQARFAPFGWEGSLSDLASFNQSAVALHGALPEGVTPDRGLAERLVLALEILTPGPNPHPTDNPEGQALFHGKAGCASCHPAPDYTDRLSHDVGTGRVLDTPSLKGGWDLVRYLHDARASSLEEVLDPQIYEKEAPLHGNIASLSASERTSLAAFVRGLGNETTFRGGLAEERQAYEPPLPRTELVPRDRIPELIEELAHPEASVRQSAARALQRVEREPWGQMTFVDGVLVDVGPGPSDAVPALMARLEDDDEGVRADAAAALGVYGKTSLPATEKLLAALARGNPDPVRVAAAIALGKIGPTEPEVLEALLAALGEKNAHVSLWEGAAIALGRIQTGAGAAVPDLSRLLEEDSRPEVRCFCVVALAKIGPDSGPAVPALARALLDLSPVVRDMAAFALGRVRVQTELSVPALVLALEDSELQVRRRAARSLGFLGESASPAVSALVLATFDPGLVNDASWALGRIGRVAIPEMTAALQRAEEDTTRLALQRGLLAASTSRSPAPAAAAALRPCR